MAIQRVFWFILVAATIWSLVMSVEASRFHSASCPARQDEASQVCRSFPPIAALELAHNPAVFLARVDQGNPETNRQWNVEVVRVNTYMDYVFIAFYWAVFVLFARSLGNRVLASVGTLITVAAILDVAENVRLMQGLDGVAAGVTQFPVPGSVSGLKWMCFAIATAMLAVALGISKKLWPMIIALPMVGSAGLIFWGVTCIQLLKPAVGLLFLSFLIAIAYYFPFRGPVKAHRLRES